MTDWFCLIDYTAHISQVDIRLLERGIILSGILLEVSRPPHIM